jgi:hypothetical protein
VVHSGVEPLVGDGRGAGGEGVGRGVERLSVDQVELRREALCLEAFLLLLLLLLRLAEVLDLLQTSGLLDGVHLVKVFPDAVGEAQQVGESLLVVL